MNKVEQVRPAVIHLAIHQKLERSPHHRQIVVDPHEGIMNALLNFRGSRFPHPVRKILKGHLNRLAVLISTIVPPLSTGFIVIAASRFAMPSNICVIGARTACCSALSTAGV